jgi:histidinol phosphatase-like PHP family hydrolase
MTNSPHTNGRFPHDYHMHSHASCDSSTTMADMGRAALNRGIAEIAFTEHFDLHPKDSCKAPTFRYGDIRRIGINSLILYNFQMV